MQTTDYPNVEYILVDPSCTGSGIVRRSEITSDTSLDRILALSRFQAMILKHALSFPSVKKVVYSTCSIHTEVSMGSYIMYPDKAPVYNIVIWLLFLSVYN